MWYKKAAIQYLKEQQVEPYELEYELDSNRISPELYSKFIEMNEDEGTSKFLEKYCKDVEGWWTTLAGNVLRYYYSLTDANAILNRGQMHVLSADQLKKLLYPGQVFDNEYTNGMRISSLLDIGSGDGNVTMNLSCLLKSSENDETWKDRVVTTELSYYMVKRLREQGFSCAETTDITRDNLIPYLRTNPHSEDDRAFDMVTLFNVLDRCDKPLSLLNDIRNLLIPKNGNLTKDTETGILLLAVVLPWGPFVEDGSSQKRPTEILPVDGKSVFWPVPMKELSAEECEKRFLKTNENINANCTPIRKENSKSCACCRCGRFEECVDWITWNTLIPNGWEVINWTRVPYIAAGDMNCRYYTLDNAVFVLKPSIHVQNEFPLYQPPLD